MKKHLLILGSLFSLTLFSCDDFSITLPPGYTVEELIAFYAGERSFTSDNGFIVHIPDDKIGSIDACIDNTMEQKYIDASIAAIEEYNKFDYVNISYILSNYCAEEYMIFGQYDDQERDYCSDDDSTVVACNLAYYDAANGQIMESKLMYNDRVMDELSQEDIVNTAIHEMGHSFGLVDLYEDEFAAISIMYYQTSEYIFTELTQFDIDNLNWFYKR
jgi:predicted Zn-dependent protease